MKAAMDLTGPGKKFAPAFSRTTKMLEGYERRTYKVLGLTTVVEARRKRNMSATWTTRHLPDKGIVLMETVGTFTREDSDRMVEEVRAMKLDPKQVGILIDHRAAIIKFATLQIYNLPATYLSVDQADQFRIANVFKQIGTDERFYETVCRNWGYRVRVFTDYDQAVQWLTPATPKK
jgi:hypothetical protein